MKQIITAMVLTVVALLAIVSCTDENNPAKQYGNTMVQSLKSTKKLDAAVNVQEVQKSIQEFNAANGRYPANLNEVSAFNGMTLKSDNFDYDSATGVLIEKH